MKEIFITHYAKNNSQIYYVPLAACQKRIHLMLQVRQTQPDNFKNSYLFPLQIIFFECSKVLPNMLFQ